MQAQSKKKQQKKQQFVRSLTVRRQMGQKSRGIIAIGHFTFLCALGGGGMKSQKREGDGATPIGTMRFLSGFRRQFYKPIAQAGFELHRIDKNDGWCDSNFDANYNRAVKLPYLKSAEKMQRDDHLYDIGLIPDWNISSRVMNKGSAIFLHLKKGDYQPTQGCVAISRRDMERLLPHISRKTKLIILP